jgi:hypothetical protein
MSAARSIAELRAGRFGADPTCDVVLRKDARLRRYVLRPDATGGYFCGTVFMSATRHRTKRVAGLLEAKRLAQQFAREIADLLRDGWTE